MTDLLHWTDVQKAAFSKENLQFTHDVDKSPLFTDEALIALIDRYPRDKLEVFTMGYDPTNWGQWYLGRRGDHDGRSLMEGVRAGRLWLNLRKVNHSDAEIGALCDAMFAEIKAKSGVTTLKQDLGLLISSPRAHVFYHLDIPLVTLWQIRGVKHVYVYPPQAPFVSDHDLEGVALRESDEQLRFSPEWDAQATKVEFHPGQMLTWVQNAPHRIVNQDSVNVSLSIEFMTPKAIWRANVIYANGCLRRWFGLNPSLSKSPKFLEPFKVVFARIVKMRGGFNGNKSPLKPRFTLDASKAEVLHFDDGVEVPTAEKKAA
ncbi:hypothetical protein [Asticcacaulis sp. YBE204]|uniref:hypothetical protein n=1 Tax=Asticcacaulis sp. YBE204 TaxID=1282363 RepID=UPI0003C4033F|nr:hypothetical protein [Asticcacaulis sp. YBE204]ESQ81216.1 hypothetical protein AEYBE204_02455 [Asticcacaulis sp. YBE204]